MKKEDWRNHLVLFFRVAVFHSECNRCSVLVKMWLPENCFFVIRKLNFHEPKSYEIAYQTRTTLVTNLVRVCIMSVPISIEQKGGFGVSNGKYDDIKSKRPST